MISCLSHAINTDYLLTLNQFKPTGNARKDRVINML